MYSKIFSYSKNEVLIFNYFQLVKKVLASMSTRKKIYAPHIRYEIGYEAISKIIENMQNLQTQYYYFYVTFTLR